MSQASAILNRPLRRGLRFFKPDHPRAIDRHIDYFGGGRAESRSADLPRFTALLEYRLAMVGRLVAAHD